MDFLNSRIGRNIGCLSLTCWLTACAVGPDYRAPDMAVPDEWHSQPQTGVRTDNVEAPLLASWWTVLDDPTLNQLIDQALAENRTVKQAQARVVEARARRAISGASFWPAVGASAGGSRSDSDVSGDRETWDGGVDASWEIDLFGGQRRAFESSTAQLAAVDADLRDVLVSLLGEVALAYVDVRTSQSRLSYAERNLESQREVVDITTWRADAGLATVLDVEQAKSSYSTTLAALPSLDSALEAGKNRLAVLTGQTPGSLEQILAERKPIPVAPAEVVSSVPADVMRRRPDIRAAERRLAAQTAQVGVATAELYPRLSLSGSIGVTAAVASDLFSGGLEATRYGLSLSMPIFSAGALRQNIKATNAQVDQALATYEATVLAAYEEVENSLTQWVNEQRRHAALIDSAGSARLASELALMQYNSGLVDFQTVLTADRQLISAEDALAVSDGEMTSNLIRLYKALGGGWSVFPPPATASNEAP
ncbi:efflux transporter outer membrane subunit [Povalibacter sp.]|uniref:efflux transporter outer membrane subunit n=1 Tax=Povalibacter sp. TaxID=1962978 RepID=UPI002F404434